ncbi:hypothetical protein EHM69_02395 [candidate division KSB1 bacterium]|nr:MAG: hypothetical protein EHM69_02395 [candidate division KSB1 bacterium]
MENEIMHEEGSEGVGAEFEQEAAVDVATEEVGTEQMGGPEVRPVESWRYDEPEPSLLDAGFTIELRNIKTAMVIAPNHPIPVAVEGLLLHHHEMPLAAEMEIILSADDREIVRERFFLPSPRRAEVMAAHRDLAQMSADFLTDSRLRDTAMRVYFPELSEEYDLWYHVSLDDNGCLNYALHLGPSHNQDIKKRIEGTLQL